MIRIEDLYLICSARSCVRVTSNCLPVNVYDQITQIRVTSKRLRTDYPNMNLKRGLFFLKGKH